MTTTEKQPVDLDWHLSRLLRKLDALDDKPDWTGVWMIEGFYATPEKQQLDRGALFTPRDFAPRFNAVVTAGHTWINLHVVGILEGRLLVSLEHVSDRIVEGCATLVNLSGPENWVRWRSWNLDELVEIRDGGGG